MTKKPVPSLISVPVTAPAEPMAPIAAPTKPRRESFHVRISADTLERVREAAHRLRRDKQDIAEEALNEWLTARGL